uniref:Protein ALWAYS EARLY 3 isoform X1 n=1 Tax=Rhizophora mucronata TaxID=61149 RepID=A0A2P2QLQ0_RHIMU
MDTQNLPHVRTLRTLTVSCTLPLQPTIMAVHYGWQRGIYHVLVCKITLSWEKLLVPNKH